MDKVITPLYFTDGMLSDDWSTRALHRSFWTDMVREMGDKDTAQARLREIIGIIKPHTSGTLYMLDGKPFLIGTGERFHDHVYLLDGTAPLHATHQCRLTYGILCSEELALRTIFEVIESRKLSYAQATLFVDAVRDFLFGIAIEQKNVPHADDCYHFLQPLQRALLTHDTKAIAAFATRGLKARKEVNVENLTQHQKPETAIEATRRHGRVVGHEADIIPFRGRG